MTTIAAVVEKAAARKAKQSKRAVDKADSRVAKKARTGPAPGAAAAQVQPCTLSTKAFELKNEQLAHSRQMVS